MMGTGTNERTAKRSPLRDVGSIVKHAHPGTDLAFTGTRNGMSAKQHGTVTSIMDALRSTHLQHFHVAAWPGADNDARAEAKSRGYTLVRHQALEGPIDWFQSAWLLIAAPDSAKPSGSGTWANITEAHRLGMTIVVVAPDGSAVLWKHDARN